MDPYAAHRIRSNDASLTLNARSCNQLQLRQPSHSEAMDSLGVHQPPNQWTRAILPRKPLQTGGYPRNRRTFQSVIAIPWMQCKLPIKPSDRPIQLCCYCHWEMV